MDMDTFLPKDSSSEPLQRDLIVSRDSYELSGEQLDKMEGSLVDNFQKQTGITEGVICLALEPTSLFADFGRTIESLRFSEVGEDYDFQKGMAPYEDKSLFLYTVDIGLGKIAHTKRLVSALSEGEREKTGITGIDVFDDRITATDPAEHLSLQSIINYHNISNIDACLNVATNNRTKRIDQPTLEDKLANPYTIISYKGVYELVEDRGIENIVAYLNRFAYDSLSTLGLEADMLGGAEYHLPLTGETEEYDLGYRAVIIPVNEHNKAAFTKIDPENEFTKLIAERAVPLYTLGQDEVTLTQIAA